MGRGLEEMPGGPLGKRAFLSPPLLRAPVNHGPLPSSQGPVARTAEPKAGPRLAEPALSHGQARLPSSSAHQHHPGTCRDIPGSYWDTAGRELRGHLTNPLLYRGGIEAQGGDARLTGAQQTRDSQAPTLLGTFRNIQHILTHSHDALKPAAH